MNLAAEDVNLLQDIETFSTNSSKRLINVFIEVQSVKQHTTSVLKKENVKLMEELCELERRIYQTESRMDDLSRRMHSDILETDVPNALSKRNT